MTSFNNHIRLSLDWRKNWKDFYVPIGCYEVEAFDDVLQEFILKLTGDKEHGKRFQLDPNQNTLRYVLTIFDQNLWVNFNVDATLASVLGFARKTF